MEKNKKIVCIVLRGNELGFHKIQTKGKTCDFTCNIQFDFSVNLSFLRKIISLETLKSGGFYAPKAVCREWNALYLVF